MMKESVLDILIYLFENYIDGERADRPDADLLREELERAGFDPADVQRALEWLDGLAGGGAVAADVTARAVRIFTGAEQMRLDTDCRGYLLHLENIGILSSSQREIVIDRLMALHDTDNDSGKGEDSDIDIEQVKWVVLMVLFSQPGQESAYARMEDLVFDEPAQPLH
jgi:Smg protein